MRQLFHGTGAHLAAVAQSPGAIAEALLAYGGTTAAGLEVLKDSSLAADLDRAVAAAYRRAKTDMTGG